MCIWTKLTFLSAGTLALLSSSAWAGDVTLCSGRAGGGYDGIVQGIANELTKRDHHVTVINMGGSEDILNALESGKCAYGPAQKDIYYLKAKNNAGFTSAVAPAATMYNEAMNLVCSADSDIDELSDLEAGDTVIVDVIGSGSALTWENMVAIEKEFGNGSSWASATAVYTPLDEAAAAIGVGSAKCAFGVSGVPASWAKEMETEGQTIAWVYDKDINDLEYAGGPLYPPVRVAAGPYTYKFDTYKVGAILFRGSKTKVDADIDKLVKRLAPSLGHQKQTVE